MYKNLQVFNQFSEFIKFFICKQEQLRLVQQVVTAGQQLEQLRQEEVELLERLQLVVSNFFFTLFSRDNTSYQLIYLDVLFGEYQKLINSFVLVCQLTFLLLFDCLLRLPVIFMTLQSLNFVTLIALAVCNFIHFPCFIN